MLTDCALLLYEELQDVAREVLGPGLGIAELTKHVRLNDHREPAGILTQEHKARRFPIRIPICPTGCDVHWQNAARWLQSPMLPVRLRSRSRR